VVAQVQGDDECARPVRSRQRGGLPTTGREAQRGVLELGLARGQRHRQLAQHLGVAVHGVARLAPSAVGKLRPQRGHHGHASAAARTGRGHKVGRRRSCPRQRTSAGASRHRRNRIRRGTNEARLCKLAILYPAVPALQSATSACRSAGRLLPWPSAPPAGRSFRGAASD
jgi:hypothetical protein